jgi:hypothetical protein
MTVTAAKSTPPPKKKKKQQKLVEHNPLESLFHYGYAESDVIDIFSDEERKIELKVKFRTLTPAEIRDITEFIELYEAGAAQIITEKIETLSRAVMYVNFMPLTLTPDEQSDYYNKYGKTPSPLEMARIIFQEKIKSLFIIDALYEAYSEFSAEIIAKLEIAKKKLKKKSSNSE